ncbi:MAG: hypothetical protein MI924_08215 [Chloroflexales bacterium]|nr:hypothetical protein [Chloroflexales bacterium]
MHNKRIARIGSWSIVLTLLCLLTQCGIADLTRHSDAYTFPVQPGTNAWQQLGSRQEMLAAVQIPEPQLAQMSTAGLVETVLQYPLAGDMYAHSSLQRGFNALRRDFNGLAILLDRPDAGRLLLQHYQTIDSAAIEAKPTNLEQGAFISSLQYIETLLAQPEILDQLSSDERIALLRHVGEQRQIRERLSAIYGISGTASAAFLAGRILQYEQALQPDDAVAQFLELGSFINEGVIETIFSAAATYTS